MKRKKRRDEVYISPDGGETVYVQKKNGTRGRLISQSQYAKDAETEQEESEMVGIEAIKLRRRYPTLSKAWDQYKTVWNLVANEEEY